MKAAFLIAALLSVTACTHREVYDSLQGARADECSKIPDADSRQRCFEQANRSYDQYERERSR